MFIKSPVPGQVKTRLGKKLGLARAANLYSCWIQLLVKELQPIRQTCRLVLYAAGPAEDFAPWRPFADELWPQPDGDLGVKIANGITAGLNWGPTLAIGSDCLEINEEIIMQSFEILAHKDAVFGPATDGGYYLVGLRGHPPTELFTGVRWSTDQTLADQLEKCQQLGLSYGILPTLADIDTLEDWEGYLGRHPEHQLLFADFGAPNLPIYPAEP